MTRCLLYIELFTSISLPHNPISKCYTICHRYFMKFHINSKLSTKTMTWNMKWHIKCIWYYRHIHSSVFHFLHTCELMNFQMVFYIFHTISFANIPTLSIQWSISVMWENCFRCWTCNMLLKKNPYAYSVAVHTQKSGQQYSERIESARRWWSSSE